MKYICNEDGEKEAVVISIEELDELYIRKVFYYYSIKGARAIGYWKNGYFYLCKGSKIKGELSGNSSFSPDNRQRVKTFIEKGVLEKHDYYYLVLEDISTGEGKHSAAASIVAGGNKSGNVEWLKLSQDKYLEFSEFLKD